MFRASRLRTLALISRHRDAEVCLIFARLTFIHFMTQVMQHIALFSVFEDVDWGHYSGVFEMNGDRARRRSVTAVTVISSRY